jgi:MoaA/NifB/PqqE/SkfB family radical SAM enzyme
MDQSLQQIKSLQVLVLNVHSRCNCRCVMCDIWKRETSQELQVSDLLAHRASWQRLGVRWVVLSGGEPLLHSDLRALCGLFRDDGIRLTLLTTGLLLKKRAAEVAEMFDDVIVSLDGPPDVHDAVRRIDGAFNLIHEGIQAVRGYRGNMRFSGRTTVQKANHCRLLDTVDSAKQLGLNSLSFLAADLTSEAFNRPVLWTFSRQSEIALTSSEVADLHREIKRLIRDKAEDFRSGFIAESADKLRRIVNHFRAHLGAADEHAPTCNAPWVSAVIEAGGAVRPCFFHPAIGNIHEGTLQDVLNSDRAREFRNKLDIATNPTCRRCVCSLNCPSRKQASPEPPRNYLESEPPMRGIQPMRQL